MGTMKATTEEIEIGVKDQQLVFNPFTAASKQQQVGDVVVPNFDKLPRIKRRKSLPSSSHHKPLQISLELPTMAKEMMRQVSGLGMEDPVFGLSNHSMIRAAGKSIPNLYDDMHLSDVPEDMRDLISVCSDPTASIHKDRSLHKRLVMAQSKHNEKNQSSRIGRMLSTTTKQIGGEPLPLKTASQRKQAFLHPFVPPKSISQLTAHAKPIKKDLELDIFKKKMNKSMVNLPEKPSDRRWRKSLIAEQLNQRKGKEDDEEVKVIIPSFPSKKKKDKEANQQHSEQSVFWEDSNNQLDVAGDRDREMPFEELFTAGKLTSQRRNTHISRSKLSASDSNLFFNGARGGKAADSIKGLELSVRDDFSRTVSGLTMEENSLYTGESSDNVVPVIVEEHQEEEMADLMQSRQISITLSELERTRHDPIDASSHLSYSVTEIPVAEEPVHHVPSTHNKKEKGKGTKRVSSRSRERLDKKGHESRESRRSRESDNKGRRGRSKSNKLDLSKEDSKARLVRHSQEKAKARRSNSLEGAARKLLGNASHRRTKKTTPRKVGSHDTAQRMLAFGNTSLQAAERANEIRSSFNRYRRGSKERTSSSKRFMQSSRASSKRFTSFHASLEEVANDKAAKASMQAKGNKSMGDLDFVVEMQAQS